METRISTRSAEIKISEVSGRTYIDIESREEMDGIELCMRNLTHTRIEPFIHVNLGELYEQEKE